MWKVTGGEGVVERIRRRAVGVGWGMLVWME